MDIFICPFQVCYWAIQSQHLNYFQAKRLHFQQRPRGKRESCAIFLSFLGFVLDMILLKSLIFADSKGFFNVLNVNTGQISALKKAPEEREKAAPISFLYRLSLVKQTALKVHKSFIYGVYLSPIFFIFSFYRDIFQLFYHFQLFFSLGFRLYFIGKRQEP